LLVSLGIALAAVGAVIGIYGFAKVQAPAVLTDAAIPDTIVDRLPEAHFSGFAALRTALEQARTAVGSRRYQASDASGYAAAATARADAADTGVKSLEASAAAFPADTALAGELAAARQRARSLRTAAAEKAAANELTTRELALATENLTLLEALRRAAYGVAAGDVVSAQFKKAKQSGVLAVALVAAGVVLLAQAPKPKAEAAPAPSLVALELYSAGKTALKCDAGSVQAIRVGGTDDKPTVITLPTADCPTSVTVDFTTDKPKPLGAVSKVKAIEPR
jgi:hypothetical protein